MNELRIGMRLIGVKRNGSQTLVAAFDYRYWQPSDICRRVELVRVASEMFR